MVWCSDNFVFLLIYLFLYLIYLYFNKAKVPFKLYLNSWFETKNTPFYILHNMLNILCKFNSCGYRLTIFQVNIRYHVCVKNFYFSSIFESPSLVLALALIDSSIKPLLNNDLLPRRHKPVENIIFLFIYDEAVE